MDGIENHLIEYKFQHTKIYTVPTRMQYENNNTLEAAILTINPDREPRPVEEND
jgi:hypothetical protein